MDKNFFKFDIDDEVVSSAEQSISAPEKMQSIERNDRKQLKNDNFICLKHKSLKIKCNFGYEKTNGLVNQKTISSNISLVEDYINFDFRSKNKIIEENQNEKSSIIEYLNDKEVEDVVSKAHIGVIFY